MSTDQQIRELALDPEQSFIVQAPAGSGKTELLTQRYLRLLSQVNYPEQILAITFTKKAAAEMRNRVVKALERGIDDAPPTAAHAKATWQLARQVLQHQQQQDWHLIQNPNRLRILTIDAFCAYLVRQMPLLAQISSQSNLADDPNYYYQLAAEQFISQLAQHGDQQQKIATLLLHVDNDISKVKRLLIDMLAKRDQWLPHLLGLPEQQLRQKLQQTLENILLDNLNQVAENLSYLDEQKLCQLAHFAAVNLYEQAIVSPIQACLNHQQLPEVEIASVDFYNGIATLLLTKEHQWRKQANKKSGFPATSSGKDKEEKELLKAKKTEIQQMLLDLAEHEALRAALSKLLLTPAPIYTDQQWKIVSALVTLLPALAAQLTLVFRDNGVIDFIQVSGQALQALNDLEGPSDLALRLDYQIQHILLDEFQDTSISQYCLLERLTMGWQNGDGRSLFLVGDPMQSIYRFRQAEVSLFLRVQQYGLTDIQLTPLRLQANFRSDANLIEWTNRAFSQIFPAYNDIDQGAISYSHATAANQSTENAYTKFHPLFSTNKQTQGEKIVEIIKASQLEKKDTSIAILVKARSHLLEILPYLRQANLAYQAVEIEVLAMSSVVHDLLALTKALLFPADSLAWLSVLRAPWCGLTLADLSVISENHAHLTILQCLQQETLWQNLSTDGKLRLQKILPILAEAITTRNRESLTCWIEGVWLAIDGPACLTETSQLDNAHAFLDLLTKFDNEALLRDFSVIEKKLNRLFSPAKSKQDNHLQIMTIHKSKGLEFDVVIIPCLEKGSRHNTTPLLSWMQHANAHGDSELLLAPINSSMEANDCIANYIRQHESARLAQEDRRLLYVAITRAKQQCHLLADVEIDIDEQLIKPPKTNSFLNYVWPIVAETCQQNYESFPLIQEKASTNLDNEINYSLLQRYQMDQSNSIQALPLDQLLSYKKTAERWQFNLPQYHAQQIGTVIHRFMQLISEQGLDTWTQDHLQTQQPLIQLYLQQHGLVGEVLQRAKQMLNLALSNTLDDTHGRWLFDQQHQHHQAEYAISLSEQSTVKNYSIDLTFIDQDNVRWIVDYKTSTPSKQQTTEEFVQQQKTTYQAQLENYAAYFTTELNAGIQLALYFPLLPMLSAWRFEEIKSTPSPELI